MPKPENPFRVKARLLRLLGDELIRDPALAVFELVKNAYDADATRCAVTLSHPEAPRKASIEVVDNGAGMTLEVIRNVWLVIATDFRAEQRARAERTKRFHRFPLGEKGLGRLAVHKLGTKISIITRSKGEDEVTLELDWDKLEEAEDLTTVGPTVKVGPPEHFKGEGHGTRIEVRDLREEWDRAKARSLQRSVSSLVSPFEGPDRFEVTFAIEPGNNWLDGLLNPSDVRKGALFHARGYFEEDKVVYDYSFRPPPTAGGAIKPRRLKQRHPLQRREEKGRKPGSLDLSGLKIGRVEFDVFIFDREPAVLHAVSEDVRGLQRYLNDNGGMRIYREGVRVFDFGEPGNDWLNLDGRRVNKPVARVSNNQILGVLNLDGAASTGLVEKSNREGFLENGAYEAFQAAVISVLTQIEADKLEDQRLVRQFFSRKGAHKPVMEEIADLREELKKKHLLQEFNPQITRVEKQIEAYQETMLRASVPGLAFGSLIHGAEKLIRELVIAVHSGAGPGKVKGLVDRLDGMMKRLGNLMRGSGTKRVKAGTLIADALFNVEFRLRAHKIDALNGVEEGDPDFMLKCTPRLIVGTITNLVDNSIYWLRFGKSDHKRLYIGTSNDISEGPCIVIADNGPGFQDAPEILTQAFFSRRPEGMGLGLYLSDEVMRVHGGRLLFPDRGDVGLPREFSGAIVALQFPQT